MDSSYRHERQVAELAVQRATILTRRVFGDHAKGTLSKDDKSPVTVADFGAQALIVHALQQVFPADDIVGEEDAGVLRENEGLRRHIWELVQESRLEDAEAEALLGGPVKGEGPMLEAIDSGRAPGGPKGRIWTVDPVDGTKGFLRGGQYAVALALIVDGDVKVGVLACPNLPADDATPIPTRVDPDGTDRQALGVLFAAVKGLGATRRALGRGSLNDPHRLLRKAIANIAEATFCESVEADHSSHGDQAAIAKRVGVIKLSLRIDSQAKYGLVARGAADVYLRLPVGTGYQEKIWDHAAGDLIVREAGGRVSDADGKPLDFGQGRTLRTNKGVIASPQGVHAQLLEAVQAVLTEPSTKT